MNNHLNNNEKNSLLSSFQNPDYELDNNDNNRERSRSSSSGGIIERERSPNIKNNNRRRKSNNKKEENQFPLGSLKIMQNIILHEEKINNIQIVNSFNSSNGGLNTDINSDSSKSIQNELINNKTAVVDNTIDSNNNSNLISSPSTWLLNESSSGPIEKSYSEVEARRSRSNSINKYSYTSHTLTVLSSIPDMINQQVPSISPYGNNSYEEIIDVQSNQNHNMEYFLSRRSTLKIVFIFLFVLILIITTSCICLLLQHFLNIDLTWVLVLSVVMIMFILIVTIISYSSLRYQLSTYVEKPTLPLHNHSSSPDGRNTSNLFKPMKRQGSFSRIP
jgi:hypothetical protein